MRIDSKETEKSKRTDKFAAFSQVWNIFSDNYYKYYTSSEYLSINETLLGFRERRPSKMYIPNKPNEYEMKIVLFATFTRFSFVVELPT